MATNRLDLSKAGETEKESPEVAETESASSVTGRLKPWLPLILSVALMPALAYLTTTFLIMPKLRAAYDTGDAVESAPQEAHGPEGSQKENPAGRGKVKFTAGLSGKVLVNIAGTMGTRYLMASLTLVSPRPNLAQLVEKNDAELRDAAAGVLASKTIPDLEKPGARNLIRTELITVFNDVLGEGFISELYLTEFAIQ